MRTEDLLYFVTVAKTRSLNKASQKLNVTYQSINTGIKNLEAEFEIPLLERTSKGTYLTKEGEIVEEFAKRILSETYTIKKQLHIEPKQCFNQYKGGLNIGVYPIINNLIIPDFMHYFHSMYPNINLHFVEYDMARQSTSIISEDFDLVLFTSHEADLKNTSKEYILYYTKLVTNAYLSSYHVLAKRQSLSMNTIAKYPIALYSQGYSDETKKYLKEFGINKISLSTVNFLTYLNSVLDGETIAFLPYCSNSNRVFIESFIPKETMLIPILNVPAIHLYSAFKKDVSKKQFQLIDLFLKSFKDFLS